MTFISSLEFRRLHVEPVPAYRHDAPEACVIDIAVPVITGNYLIANGQPQLTSPKGQTMVVATPVRAEGEVLIHLAFGTEQRRIAHTLTPKNFGELLKNLETVLALALLEQGN